MNRSKLMVMCGLVLGVCAAFAPRAEAQCGVSLKVAHAALTPGLPAISNFSANKPTPPPPGGEGDIVGLWDVKFLIDGVVGDEGFDQYHSDGTEILNDTPPPAAGNVCLGVWEKKGHSIVLKHPSWIYDPTNTFVVGTATILETINVAKGGQTFTGTFTIQFRDLSGNSLGPDLGGQLQATRITPN